MAPGTVDGVLMDLGTSALQLKSFERGFSFFQDGPLDMRMDRSQTTTARDLLHVLSEEQLADLFWKVSSKFGLSNSRLLYIVFFLIWM